MSLKFNQKKLSNLENTEGKKMFDKKWTDPQRTVVRYHKFLYTVITILEGEEK